MGKRGSRTWHRNEHSWRNWLNCWVSPRTAAHAPAGSSAQLAAPRDQESNKESSSQSCYGQQWYEQFFLVIMFATTICISATVEKCPLAQAMLRKMSCCLCCTCTCPAWCRQHPWLYQGFIRLVCCWLWIFSSLLCQCRRACARMVHFLWVASQKANTATMNLVSMKEVLLVQ